MHYFHPFHLEVHDENGVTMVAEFPTVEDAERNYKNMAERIGDKYDLKLLNVETDELIHYRERTPPANDEPVKPPRDAATAEADLRASSHESLYEWVYESHKDFYGVKGRHMFTASKEQLVEWILNHFKWDEAGQYWTTIKPFEGE